jgi:Tol biopolymer transport system component
VKIGVFSLAHEEMLALSPTGDTLAAINGGRRETWTNKSIVLVDLSGATTPGIRRLTGPAVTATHPAWSPDGGKLAWSEGPDAEELEKQQLLASGKKTVKLITGAGGLREIPITPELRVGAGDDMVKKSIRMRRIWTAAIGGQAISPILLTNDADYSDEAPVWSSDGSHILFARTDAAGTKSLWLMRNDGSDLREVASPLTFEPLPKFGFGGSASGFYGYTPWLRFFDWSRSL